MLVAFLPQILLGPFIGAYIDRWNRKRTMIIADLAVALVTVALVLLFTFDAVEVWHIYVAMILRAIGQSFHFPAMLASIPMIVPEKHLTRVSGLNQMLQGIVSIAAPPAGALLLGILSMQQVLAIDILTAAVAILCLVMVTIPQPEKSAGQSGTSALKDMTDGFRYIWSWRGLKLLLVLTGIFNFFLMPAFTLLPILVTRQLGGDVLKLGWLESAFGVGIIAAGLVLSIWGGFRRRMLTVLIGSIVAGMATFSLGFTSLPLFWLGLSSAFIIGAGLSFANGPILAVVQAAVDKEMQGRVFSLMGSISGAVTPFGLAVAGPLADAIGISPLYWIAGIAIFFLSISALFMPSVLNLGVSQEKIPQKKD